MVVALMSSLCNYLLRDPPPPPCWFDMLTSQLKLEEGRTRPVGRAWTEEREPGTLVVFGLGSSGLPAPALWPSPRGVVSGTLQKLLVSKAILSLVPASHGARKGVGMGGALPLAP
ncbi:hypothetical protein E2320_007273 [Naja naja]|nr:hypothetical protein E2320_007273 [Naja naja]